MFCAHISFKRNCGYRLQKKCSGEEITLRRCGSTRHLPPHCAHPQLSKQSSFRVGVRFLLCAFWNAASFFLHSAAWTERFVTSQSSASCLRLSSVFAMSEWLVAFWRAWYLERSNGSASANLLWRSSDSPKERRRWAHDTPVSTVIHHPAGNLIQAGRKLDDQPLALGGEEVKVHDEQPAIAKLEGSVIDPCRFTTGGTLHPLPLRQLRHVFAQITHLGGQGQQNAGQMATDRSGLETLRLKLTERHLSGSVCLPGDRSH